MSEWVKCSERLPDGRRTVLVWLKGGVLPIIWTWMGKNWAVNVTAEILGRHQDITHWMPLPEPPKEGE